MADPELTRNLRNLGLFCFVKEKPWPVQNIYFVYVNDIDSHVTYVETVIEDEIAISYFI